MKLEDLITRVDQLIAQGADVLSTRSSSRMGLSSVDYPKFSGFGSAVLSFFDRVYSKDHPHYERAHAELSGAADPSSTGAVVEMLHTVREELEGGWLFELRGLVSAEIFADFLEMAEYLLDQGYKDPAAVMIGSTLEEHIRQLCQINGVDVDKQSGGKLVPISVDRLNAELVKASVYKKLDQKNVTAWYGLRTDAAHGKYGDYTADQVRNMLDGVREFIARVAL